MPRPAHRTAATHKSSAMHGSNIGVGLARATGESARLSALQAEHQRLLKDIARKRKELEKWRREIDATIGTTAELDPLRDEALQIDRDLHALFTEILARKRFPRAERRMVSAVYQVLREIGVLSPVGSADRSEDDEAGAPGEETAGDRDGSNPYEAGSGARQARTAPHDAGASADRVESAAPGDGSVRDVFRRLASAVHPDRVLDANEKLRRTELMKDISRAYQEHDLARLLHLERTLKATVGPAPAIGDSFSRNLATLNAGLRAQLKALGRELLGVRHSPQAELVKALRRWARAGGAHPVAALIAEAREEVASMRELRAFVTSYRDGRITVEELVRGPAAAHRARARVPRSQDEDHR